MHCPLSKSGRSSSSFAAAKRRERNEASAFDDPQDLHAQHIKLPGGHAANIRGYLEPSVALCYMDIYACTALCYKALDNKLVQSIF
jgi:hypothetical protein